MRWSAFSFGIIFSAVLWGPAWPKEPACHDNKAADAAKDAAAVALDRLKTLVGEWEMVKPPDESSKGKTAVRYRLTGGGTAVAETIFPDSAMEMLSVYHRDGEQLVMTHYCAAGNQPRMRTKIGKDKDELVFEFAGGSNLNPAKDMHVHGGRVRFVDADHIHAEWEMYADGKAATKHSFDLVRKKK